MLIRSTNQNLTLCLLFFCAIGFAAENNDSSKEKTQDCLSLYMPHFFTRMGTEAQQSLQNKAAVSSYLTCVRKKCVARVKDGYVDSLPMACFNEPQVIKEKKPTQIIFWLEAPRYPIKGFRSFISTQERETTRKQKALYCIKDIPNQTVSCSLGKFVDYFPNRLPGDYVYDGDIEYVAKHSASKDGSKEIYSALKSLHKLQQERRSILEYNSMLAKESSK